MRKRWRPNPAEMCGGTGTTSVLTSESPLQGVHNSRLSGSHYLSGLNCLKCGKGRGYYRLQVAKAVCGRAENQDGDPPASDVLLLSDALVDRDQHFKPGGLSGIEELSVGQSREPGKAGGLAVVAGKQEARALVTTFVDQKPHRSWDASIIGCIKRLPAADVWLLQALLMPTRGKPSGILPETPRSSRRPPGSQTRFEPALASRGTQVCRA